MKKSRNHRLSDEAIRLMLNLAAKLGLTQTAVLEMAVRTLAEKENVK